jgi:hypothetical protein
MQEQFLGTLTILSSRYFTEFNLLSSSDVTATQNRTIKLASTECSLYRFLERGSFTAYTACIRRDIS